jgi:hypothetical protein
VRFGGAAQFGTTEFGGDPFGVSPAYVCDRLISVLSRFVTAKTVKTVRRYAGAKEDDLEAIDRLLTTGVPAFLVFHAPGKFDPMTTDGRRFNHRLHFGAYCCAGDYQSQTRRLEGRNDYSPGIDNLMRWAIYFCGRELLEVKELRGARPLGSRYLRFEPGKYVGVVEFEAVNTIDFYDDAPANALERLGLVKNPTDPEELFQGDNLTPNSTDPNPGGVFSLEA